MGQLNETEKAILQAIDKKYTHIARDYDGNLFLFCEKPWLYKDENNGISRYHGKTFVVDFDSSRDEFVPVPLCMFSNMFKQLTFANSPYLIADLF